jgi:hypothetical protein
MSAHEIVSRAQFVYASPERQQQIRKAVTPLLPNTYGPVKPTVGRARNEAVIRALTFSGVPAKHLAGLTAIQPNRRPAENSHAHYDRREMHPVGSQPAIKAEIVLGPTTSDMLSSPDRLNRRLARHSLVHEVGHHVHAETNPQDYYTHTDAALGRAEAIAENYGHLRSPASGYDTYDRMADSGAGWGPVGNKAYKRTRAIGLQPEEV